MTEKPNDVGCQVATNKKLVGQGDATLTDSRKPIAIKNKSGVTRPEITDYFEQLSKKKGEAKTMK